MLPLAPAGVLGSRQWAHASVCALTLGVTGPSWGCASADLDGAGVVGTSVAGESSTFGAGESSTGAAGTAGVDPPPDLGAAPPPTEACYPGATLAFDLCVPLVSAVGAGAEYDYPEPYGASPQYRPPVAFLPVEVLEPDLGLAADFRLAEVAPASRGPWAVVSPSAIERLQAVRDRVGPLEVSSGYRSPADNAAVSGAPHSRHMYGDGFDLVPVVVSFATLAQACADEGADYIHVYTGHVHCDWRTLLLDPAFFGGEGDAQEVAAGDEPEPEPEGVGELQPRP